MNEFIEQFLIESRELIAQATDDLLTLEENPAAQDRLDGAFRAFHTLKGAAGIVDFDAMGRALHAAEDVLSAVRAGNGEVTPQLIGDCLTCLDQVVQWLDAMEGDGEIPAGADAQADAVVSRFSRTVERAASNVPTPGKPAASGWIAGLAARHPLEAGRALSGLRWSPDPDCFLRGEDPLLVLAAVPGLLALDMAPAGSWPSLEEFEPFACQLVFAGLSDADVGAVQASLANETGDIEVRALDAAAGEAIADGVARRLIQAQCELLADPAAEPTPGRTASARAVAVNVLRSLGRDADAERMNAIEADGLAGALQAVLAGAAIAAEPGPVEQRSPQEAAARAIRVDVERIDALVNLAGELTVAKNALAHAVAQAEAGAPAADLAGLLKVQHGQLERLVAELQRSVLNIRVLPLRQVFQRFPRLVREMVTTLGKPARLVTEGDDTEADKAIVEALFEPLLHLIRNALDHGIEAPEVRAAAHKPPSATILLSAHRAGGQVVVEVADDGAGIDVSRVRAAAAARGVASPEALAEMSDEEAAELVFAPGFSTAAEVTSLSGRGVGMDAVRSAVERMDGRVGLEVRPGQGTTVRLTLPFTVMMSSVMTVEAGGQMFGIPLDALVETVRLPRAAIVGVGAAKAFVWRDRTAPLIDLAEALGEPRAAGGIGDAQVVVTSTLGQLAALEVERIGERMDVMLKPMEGLLAGAHGLAGATTLGDGRVLLVLDLQALL